MKNLPVSRIMASPPVTVLPDEPLDAALALMESRRVHHLLVVEGGRIAGILSSADMLKLALLRKPETEAGSVSFAASVGIRVRDIMQSHVAVVRENASLKETARALSLGGFHALPVLAVDGTPVGIVTSSDLVALLIDQIERDAPAIIAPAPSADEPQNATTARLLEVLRAAEIYLHSGQCDQQHARLTRAVACAREAVGTEGYSSRPGGTALLDIMHAGAAR
jgi:CBS domain-containing protein